MRVFVIPTWHPTATRPHWCSWILPHIALLREHGLDAYVLQLGLDDEPVPVGTDPWKQTVREIGPGHLYVSVPRPRRNYQQLYPFYYRFLAQYARRMYDLYDCAATKWGRPDLLHAHVSMPGGYLASQLGRALKLPVVVQEHYSGFESDARFPWRKAGFLRQMGRHVSGFYAVSGGFARRIEKTGMLRVTGVLPNPVDLEIFAPGPAGMRENKFRIVTTGDLSPIKGTDLLLAALRQLPDRVNWSLTIFGGVEARSHYARWLEIPEIGQRVNLPGRRPQSELAVEYRRSDLFVVSSRSETANVSMLECMACGVPVLSTRCGGPETLIDDSVGLLIEPDDADALADGIERMAIRCRQYDRHALRQFVAGRYSKATVGRLVLDAYDRAAAGAAV